MKRSWSAAGKTASCVARAAGLSITMLADQDVHHARRPSKGAGHNGPTSELKSHEAGCVEGRAPIHAELGHDLLADTSDDSSAIVKVAHVIHMTIEIIHFRTCEHDQSSHINHETKLGRCAAPDLKIQLGPEVRELSFAPQGLRPACGISRACTDPGCLSTSAPRVTAFLRGLRS